MTKVPDVNLVGYLVSRRFPAAKAIRVLSAEHRKELLSEIAAYENELRAKTPAELQALFDQECKKAVEELAAKAAREEQERFCNQPHANADFQHWSKAAHWTLDEAIALSFGKAPEIVNWEKIKPLVHVSPFAFQYQRRRDLILRALKWDQLFDPVLPGFFLAWAKRTDLAFPPELESTVAARGIQVADWKKLYDDLKVAMDENHQRWRQVVAEKNATIEKLLGRINEIQQPSPGAAIAPPHSEREKAAGARELESLMKLVIGMAIGAYGYDPKASRSKQTSEIAEDLTRAGVALDADTVRKWLKLAAEHLPSEQAE
jgi:hypothetical protein